MAGSITFKKEEFHLSRIIIKHKSEELVVKGPHYVEAKPPCGIALVGRDVKKMQSFSQSSGTSPELTSEALSRAPILPSASEASTSAEVSPKSLPNKNIQDIINKTTAQRGAQILAVTQVQKFEPAILFYMNRNLFRPIIYFKTGDVMLPTTDLLLLWTSLARL